MNHPIFHPMDSSRGLERAPLTRLRASARPAAAMVDRAAASRLPPDARTWGLALADVDLPAAEVAALNELARVSQLAPGETVFGQSDSPRGLLLLSQGDVALGVRGEDGNFRTERHMHGPAWLDASAALLGVAYTCDARVMTPAAVVELPREELLRLLERFPGIARRLLLAVAREARALALNTHELMHKDAPSRLAAWLNARCQAGLDGAGLVQLPMRKRDIASQLAITPETLSRLMRSFSGQGWIRVAGYTVHVLDRAALQRLAKA